MATYATLWTISDSVEQKFISKKEQMDYKKSVRMVTVGTFVVAPLVFTWMFLAERMFPGRAIKTVAKKMITDQVVFAPVAISTFYFSKLIYSILSMWMIFSLGDASPDSFPLQVFNIPVPGVAMLPNVTWANIWVIELNVYLGSAGLNPDIFCNHFTLPLTLNSAITNP